MAKVVRVLVELDVICEGKIHEQKLLIKSQLKDKLQGGPVIGRRVVDYTVLLEDARSIEEIIDGGVLNEKEEK